MTGGNVYQEHDDVRVERFQECRRRTFLMASAAAIGFATASPALAALQPPERPDAVKAWRKAPTIALWPDAPPTDGFAPVQGAPEWPQTFLYNIEAPRLHVFKPKRPNGRALLVIPGGAYTFISIANEGVDIADYMTGKGYTVFVLIHRLPGEGWAGRDDVPLQDAQRAARVIRSKAPDYGCDPDRLFVLGFSAGGHLAATLATAFDEDVYARTDDADDLSARPEAVGLIYPVISHEPGIGHADSSLKLLGPAPDEALVARRSPALHVTEMTPPAFFVHALDDTAVPPENSRIMIRALEAAGRPLEAHFFEEGGHGFGPGRRDLPAHQWLGLFSAWLDRHAAERE